MVLILDTDPGVDDMLALLLLLSIPKSQHELRLIALTFGNSSLKAALRNALSLFHVIELENVYRKEKKLPPVTDQRPQIALGMVTTIDNITPADAEDVHGNDGLGGIHSTHPEYSAPQAWIDLFDPKNSSQTDAKPTKCPFVVNAKPAWEAILDVLKEEPENTVTIISIGPLSNVAKAAETDPVEFSRVKEVMSMGGAVLHPGNVTPLAEFNVYADPVAAARVYALTSKKPAEMLPPGSPDALLKLPKPLNLTIFPLDLTERHLVTKDKVEKHLQGAIKNHPDSVLPKWVQVWMDLSFVNYGRILGFEISRIQLHDPLTAAAAVLHGEGWESELMDVRVETTGQWSVGKTLTDTRGRARLEHNPHDYQKWLTKDSGNQVRVMTKSAYEKDFGDVLFQAIVKGL